MAEEKKDSGQDIEEEELGLVINKFVQKEAFNAHERMLCNYLIQSITGEPLEQNIYIYRAVFSLSPEDVKSLAIDMSEVESLYSVSQILAGVYTTSDEFYYRKSIRMDSLNYARDIMPWVKMDLYSMHMPSSNPNDNEEYIARLEKTNPHTKIIENCKRLTSVGFNHILSDFLRYSTPKAQILSRKVSTLVSPNTYNEMFQIMTKPSSLRTSGGVN